MRLIYLTLAWLAGIWLAAGLDIAGEAIFWALLALGLAAALFVCTQLRQQRLRLLSLVLLALPLGALRYGAWPQGDAVAALAGRGGVTLLGVVASEPTTRGTITQFQLAVDSQLHEGEQVPIRGRVWVRARREASIDYGDYVRVGGLLVLPAEVDTFSYADYLARQGVFSVLTNAHVQRLEGGFGNRLRALLVDSRAEGVERISHYLPEPEAGLLAGIVLGDESGISDRVQEQFARVGAAHIIAISGFNMTVLTGLLTVLLQHLGIGRWRLLWVLLLWMALYTLLVGVTPAVTRAALMSAVLVLGYALQRRVNVIASLSVCTLLLTLENPTLLWDIGFQLSAGGVLGIGLCFRTSYYLPIQFTRNVGDDGRFRLRPELRRLWRNSGQMLRVALTVTLAASLFTIPLQVAHFGQISPWWLAVNLLIIPAQGATLVLGMLATLLSYFAPPLAAVAFWFAYLPLHWTVAIVRAFADFPLASLDFRLSTTVLLIWFVGMIALTLFTTAEPRRWRMIYRWLGQRWLFTVTLVATLALLLLFGLRLLSRPDGWLHVWFLDLGNSNGVFVQTPAGAQLLIDGGRYAERLLTQVGERMPFYDRRIEAVIFTQPDERDIAALTALLRRYEVPLLASNGQAIQSAALWEWEAELAAHSVVPLRAGNSLRFGGAVLLQVLHPRQPPALTEDLDDGALVLRLEYGEVSFLLTGDSSVEAQAEWLKDLAPVTVLQLPRHGAARSLHEELLERSAAQYFVLGAESSAFGQGPDADLLASLPADRPLFQTEQWGVLHFRTDGQRLELIGAS